MKNIYLKKILKAACCLMLTGVLTSAAGILQGNAEAMSERQIINFNTNWLYSPNEYTNAELSGFDDSGFEPVSIPHANKILEKHKGPNFQSQIESYRFVSWYRRHFALPECYAEGKRVIVEFEGVATVAEVYVNGNFVGEHKGAYTGFAYDITDYINSDGADNVIALKVDSTKRTDIPPEGGRVDYCLFGGIVRDVNMIIAGSTYVENTFISTPGLEESDGESTTLHAETKVINKSGEDKEYTVNTILKDAEGSVVTQISSTETVKENEIYTFVQNSEKIVSPHLWHGLDDPYLYTVLTRVMDGEECIDDYETKIGFRWTSFKDEADDASFCLNGEPLKLLGINRHEQWPWIGRAVVNRLQERDADLIKETGFNAVRCSHYPQDPSFLERCDELGLIVFEEAPGWQHIGDAAWREVYKENIREMIVRDRNHPSIVTWGVRVNESNDNDTLYTETNQIARELDPTRPTHGARREDTYSGSNFLEDIYAAHYVYPETPVHTPFIVTEHSWDCWTNGYGYPWATDEQALAFTKDFADKVNYYYGNKLCAGGFAWSMFDYDNEVNYTRTNNVFYSGLYDIFRLAKPAANLYISQKDPEKYGANIYIANYWDDDAKPLTVNAVSGDIAQGGSSGSSATEGENFAVTVMSNCDTVELYINGVKVDKEPTRQYTNLPHPFFVFDDVTYEAGEITAIGYIDGEEAARYAQKTPGTPTKLIVKPDDDSITADGADFTSVTVMAVDANGTHVPLANNTVTITVNGDGKFIGEKTIALEGGRTAFFVQSLYNETGNVHCTVTADNMESAECDITVTAFEGEKVPVSSGDGDIEPIQITNVNDSEIGITLNTFSYEGNWLTTSQNGCYAGDNYYSNTADDVCKIEFAGTNIKWYGSTAPNHGIMAISVDGGEEMLVDCYSSSRYDNIELYDSGELEPGIHTLSVRVTGTKNAASSDCYVNVDRVSIINASDTGYEEKKYSFTEVVSSDGRENQGDVAEWMVTSAPQYFYIDTVDFDKIESISIRSGYEINSAVTDIYAYDNGGEPVTKEQLQKLCSDVSVLGEPVASIADEKIAQWGYRSAKITDTDIIMGEGSGYFEILDTSKPLSIPEGIGTKALIVGISGDIGTRAYFDNITLLQRTEEKDDALIKITSLSRNNNALNYTLEVDESLKVYDIYIAVYKKDGRLAAVQKNCTEGSFVLDADEKYTFKVFVWDEMNPVMTSIVKEISTPSPAPTEPTVPSESQEPVFKLTFDEENTGNGSFEATIGGTVTENGAVNYEISENGTKALSITQYSGTNYLELPEGILNGSKAASISFWVKPSDKSNSWAFMTTPISDTQTYMSEKYLGIITATNKVSAERYNNSGTRLSTVTYNDGFSDWYHVAAIFEANGTRLYVNGELVAQDNTEVDIEALMGAGTKTWIGHANWGTSGEGFIGMLDDFYIYNRVLNEEEIVQEAKGKLEDVEVPEIETMAVSLNKSTGGNPILRTDGSGNQIYTGDPAAVVVDDEVYLIVGHDIKASGYTIPEWISFKTSDMKNWEYCGVLLDQNTIPWRRYRNDAWASQMTPYTDSEGNTKYYFYFCTRHAEDFGYTVYSIGVAVSDTPAGPYTSTEAPLVNGLITDAGRNHGYQDIDPTVWIDKDANGNEHRYIMWGNENCFIAELNEDMVSIKDMDGDGEITYGTDVKEMTFANTEEGFTEAPWLYRRQDENGNYYGKYYMFAAWGWGEKMGYATADDPWGPWTFEKMIMNNTLTSNTNHPSVIDFKGKTYFIYHNGALPGGTGGSRSVCCQEIKWNDDGSIEFMEELSVGLHGTASTIAAFDGSYIGHDTFTNPADLVEGALTFDIKSYSESNGTDTQWEIVAARAVPEGENADNYVSIQSVNRVGYFIKSCESAYSGKVETKMASDNSATMQEMMSYKTVKALDSSDRVSFESVAYPGQFLCVENGILKTVIPTEDTYSLCSFTVSEMQ